MKAFTTNEIQNIVAQQYGLEGKAASLRGEIDFNYRIDLPNGEAYVFKVAHPSRDRELLDLENKVIDFLHDPAHDIAEIPKIIPSKSAKKVVEITKTGSSPYLGRLLTFLPGIIYEKANYHSPKFINKLGGALGRMDEALAGFSHPALDRELKWWLLSDADEAMRTHLDLVEDIEVKAILKRVLTRFTESVHPKLSSLPTQAIHNDVNDFNVLMEGDLVTGIIDFGDVRRQPRVCELAIAASYIGRRKPDPLQAAAAMAAGYHSANPLTENEIALLFDLIEARLAVSLVMAYHRAETDPRNFYNAVSIEPAGDTLKQLASFHPDFAHYTFRHACGWEPSTENNKIVHWLLKNQTAFSPVVQNQSSAAVFDLSPGSLMIPDLHVLADTEKFTALLFGKLEADGASVGIGRYDEPRLIYSADMFRTQGNDGPEWRSVHIGMDVWAEAGTPVFAPLDGIVHSFANNAARLDYGPTIILKHNANGAPFYTLYGHLSEDSLEGMTEGMDVAKGAQVASIGAPPINGGWPPHLHFQVITNLLGKRGEFPGVALPSQRAVLTSICPDPNLILCLPESLFPTNLPESKIINRKREKHLGRNLSISYKKPLHIVRGRGQYLYDADGQRYLDCSNNVCHVGHAHPKIVEAISTQAAVVNTNTRYLHQNIVALADRLAATMPEPLSVCYFVNSGSEANDLAVRLARIFTGQQDLLVLEGAYHGNLGVLVDISPYKHAGPGGMGAPPWVHPLPLPCVFRGDMRKSPDPASGYAAHTLEAIEHVRQSNGRAIAGFISESIIGTGGQVVFPDGYLKKVYGHVRAAGGVCIADEVQHGFGRVGTHFWGFETHGVVPDIVTMGKPFGNGHPLAAVVTTPAIAAAFDNGMEYFNTFGGNPVSCAAGLAVMDVIESEHLQQHALEVGEFWKMGMLALKDIYSLIGDVRGAGLFLGMELVRDRETLEPADTEASYIVERLRDRGILLSTDGPLHNVIKIKPPMVIQMTDVEGVLAEMDSVFQEI